MEIMEIQNNAVDIATILNGYAVNLDVSSRTKATYLKCVSYYIAWLGDNGLKGSRADVIAYKERLMQLHSTGTVSVYMGAVRSLYAFLHEEYGMDNAAAGVKGCRKSKGFKRDALTVQQAKQTLSSIGTEDLHGLRDFAMVNLMIRTGLRCVEVSRADVGDIRNVGADAVLYIQGKGHGSKDDYVILDNDTLTPIQRYMAARSVTEGVSDAAPLFASVSNNNAGGRMTTRAVSQICKDSMRSAGIVSSRLTAHSLRHTAVTFALMGGASLQDAKAMARHESIDTTLIYAHNLERNGTNAGERCISRLLAGEI